MNTEQKAKAYDKVLERARKSLHAAGDVGTGIITFIFPELRESEDERIIKEIRDLLVNSCEADRRYPYLLAWLEKQKEEEGYEAIPVESTLEYKLGFKAGKESEKQKEQKELPLMDGNADLYFDEWNQQKQNPTKRQCFEEGMRYAERLQKEQKPILKFKVGDKIHLIDGTSPNYEDDCITIREIGTINYIGEFKEGYVPIKEQYKWELAKEQKPADQPFEEWLDDWYQGSKEAGGDVVMSEKEFKNWSRGIRNMFEQKPAEWSEEDNIGWDEAFACVTRAEKAAKNEEELQNAVTAEKWLKEIKFKYYVRPVKQEWSEEEKQKLNRIYSIIGWAMEQGVVADGEIGYWNQTGLSILPDKSLKKLGFDMDEKVVIQIRRKDE